MSDENSNESTGAATTFDLGIFNVSGESQPGEINFDENFQILQDSIDEQRRC